MALTSLITSILFVHLLDAQVIPVGNQCVVDACIKEFIPTYEEGLGEWNHITSCIDLQAIAITSTYTSYAYMADVTTTRIHTGCPKQELGMLRPKRQETLSSSLTEVSSSNSITTASTLETPCPTSPSMMSACSPDQISSICECALFVYPYSSTTTTTRTATLGNVYYTDEYVSCSALIDYWDTYGVPPQYESDQSSWETSSAPFPNTTIASPVTGSASSLGYNVTTSPCPVATSAVSSAASTSGPVLTTTHSSLSWSNASSSAAASSGWNVSIASSTPSVWNSTTYSTSGVIVTAVSSSWFSSDVGWNGSSAASTPSGFSWNTTSWGTFLTNQTESSARTSSTLYNASTAILSSSAESPSTTTPVQNITVWGNSSIPETYPSTSVPSPFSKETTKSNTATVTSIISVHPVSSEWSNSTDSGSVDTASSYWNSSVPATSLVSVSSEIPPVSSSSVASNRSLSAVSASSTKYSLSLSTAIPDSISSTSGDVLGTSTSHPPALNITASSSQDSSTTLTDTVTSTRTNTVFTSSDFAISSRSIVNSTFSKEVSSSYVTALSSRIQEYGGYGPAYSIRPTSSTLASPVIPSETISCVPSYLNSTKSATGYQAIYAADYSGCVLDPYDARVGFQMIFTNTQELIVNVNGKAQIPRDPSDFEDAYYTFEQNADICGVFDLVFHYEDEASYMAIYAEGDTVGFERRSSNGQSMADIDYITSIWSVDCAGNIRAGVIGAAELVYEMGADRKLRASASAFVAPKSRRTVRKCERMMHLEVVPVNAQEREARWMMKKMPKQVGVKARRP